MKTELILSALLAACVLGCKKEESVAQQLEKVKTEAKAVREEMNDFTFAQKAEFIKQMDLRLATLNQEMEVLAAKIEKSNEAVKAEAEPKLKALREQSAQLAKRLEEVRNSSESTWDEVRIGARNAFEKLKDGFQDARKWAAEKIAP